MDQLRQWLKRLTSLLADVLDATWQVDRELTPPPTPTELGLYSCIFTPRMPLIRAKEFMDKDLGNRVYDVIQAEAEHAGVGLKHVTIDYSPRTKQARLRLAIDCQQQPRAASMSQEKQASSPPPQTEDDSTLP